MSGPPHSTIAGMDNPVNAAIVILGGATLLVAGFASLATDTVNPLANDADNLGQSLLLLGTPLVNAWCNGWSVEARGTK